MGLAVTSVNVCKTCVLLGHKVQIVALKARDWRALWMVLLGAAAGRTEVRGSVGWGTALVCGGEVRALSALNFELYLIFRGMARK